MVCPGLFYAVMAQLGRPHIDVTLRISGFFRDAFPNLVQLVDEAIRTVAELDAPPEQNFVRKHALAAHATYGAAGVPGAVARTRSLYRIDATAQVVEDWMSARLAEQYVLDPQVQQFFQEKNPWALRSIIERLIEAVQRGLWEQPDQAQLVQMRQLYLQLEGELEERTETI